MNNEARVQVDIGVQVNPQDNAVASDSTTKWCYVLIGILTLETLATLFFLGWR
jgi:hypothetical protein